MELRELKAELIRQGIGQRQLAKKLNLSTMALNYKLNGKRSFKKAERLEVLKILGYPNNAGKLVLFFYPEISKKKEKEI